MITSEPKREKPSQEPGYEEEYIEQMEERLFENVLLPAFGSHEDVDELKNAVSNAQLKSFLPSSFCTLNSSNDTVVLSYFLIVNIGKAKKVCEFCKFIGQRSISLTRIMDLFETIFEVSCKIHPFVFYADNLHSYSLARYLSGLTKSKAIFKKQIEKLFDEEETIEEFNHKLMTIDLLECFLSSKRLRHFLWKEYSEGAIIQPKHSRSRSNVIYQTYNDPDEPESVLTDFRESRLEVMRNYSKIT